MVTPEAPVLDNVFFGGAASRFPLPASLISAALDLFLPRACVACDGPMSRSDSGVVCGLCWSRIQQLPWPQCERCGHPLRSDVCQWCDLLPPYVRAVRSVCWMPIEPASSIVHALKYDGWSVIAAGLADRMSRLPWPRDVVDERKALIPIPLASARKRQRGYNQSGLIASELGKRWRIPVWEDAVQRTRETETQTRLTPEDRRANVAGSFCVGGDLAGIADAHLVIVDDVVTTAATLNSCAKVLYEAGARIISYVTFGRAHASGDRL
ncbi:MAG TPA: ComF family protein [Gemmatimonadaceae bacterium]|nr:ComF family protein [Gemmatimonadaceae bacterium]